MRTSGHTGLAVTVTAAAPPRRAVAWFGRWVAQSLPEDACVLNIGAGSNKSGDLELVRRRAGCVVGIDQSPRIHENEHVDERHQQCLEVFAEDATFLDDPFVQPVSGTEAIREYWKDVPYHQSEIKFTTGEVFVVGPWFSTEFRLVYRRRRTGDWVDARGAIFCELKGEKIGEMRMYWIRR